MGEAARDREIAEIEREMAEKQRALATQRFLMQQAGGGGVTEIEEVGEEEAAAPAPAAGGGQIAENQHVANQETARLLPGGNQDQRIGGSSSCNVWILCILGVLTLTSAVAMSAALLLLPTDARVAFAILTATSLMWFVLGSLLWWFEPPAANQGTDAGARA